MAKRKTPNNRAVGKRNEREAVHLVKPLWPDARRGYQTRCGGDEPDIENTPFWFEVKRRVSIAVFRFMEQALDARAEYEDPRLPVVMLREKGNASWAYLIREEDMEKVCEIFNQAYKEVRKSNGKTT